MFNKTNQKLSNVFLRNFKNPSGFDDTFVLAKVNEN